MTTTKTLTDLITELCSDNYTLHGFYRAVYKAVECGPSIGFRIRRKDGKSKRFYCDDLRQLPEIADMEKNHMAVTGIHVSSIVENSDVEIPGDWIEHKAGVEAPTVADFWRLVEEVNEEADFYWQRDNTRHFIFSDGSKNVPCKWPNFSEAQWPDGFPFEESRRQSIEDMLDAGLPLDEPVSIGIGSWTVTEWQDNSTF